MIIDFFATVSLLSASKWHTHKLQEFVSFFIGLSSCADHDHETSNLVNLVILNFWENQLLTQADAVVSASVKGFFRNASEVTDARQRDADQPIKEFVHPIASQGHFTANGHSLAELKCGYRLFSMVNDRLLTGNNLQVTNGCFQCLRILHSFAYANIQNNLIEPRYLHDIFVAKTFHHGRHHFGLVFFLKPCQALLLPSQTHLSWEFENIKLQADCLTISTNLCSCHTSCSDAPTYR